MLPTSDNALIVVHDLRYWEDHAANRMNISICSVIQIMVGCECLTRQASLTTQRHRCPLLASTGGRRCDEILSGPVRPLYDRIGWFSAGPLPEGERTEADMIVGTAHEPSRTHVMPVCG